MTDSTEASEVKQAAQQLAKDLDKAPSGEQIIERLLSAQVLVQREQQELRRKIAALTDQIAALTRLVDSHQHSLEQLSRPRIVH